MTKGHSGAVHRAGKAEAAPGATGAAAEAEVQAAATAEAQAAELEADRLAQIAELQVELESRTRLAEDRLDQLQRLAADFDNFRRRTQREKEELSLYGAEQFVKTILPVLDNLERALQSTGDESALRTGVELTARQLREALAKAGVQPIVALGEAFDPRLHMAVAVDAESEAAEDTVVEELQRGYQMGERVLRPSMVRVAKK